MTLFSGLRRWARVGALVLAAYASDASAVDLGGRVPLDQATEAQLADLPGVGAQLASDIVALRAKRGGRISSVEELRVIPGISEEAIDALRSGTTIRLAISVGSGKVYATPEEVLAEFEHEPSVQDLHDWSSEYAKVQPDLVDRWLRASRAFAALPQVRIAYQVDDDWQNQFRRYDEFGNPPTTTEGTFFDVQTDADVGQGRSIDVWATWDLDKIVMSSEQIRVINEAQDIAKLREKVLGEVTRLYFERRRLQVEMLLRPKTDLLAQVKDELRLRELTANLDAYSGGRFSEATASAKGR
jgi:hypothetical protein